MGSCGKAGAGLLETESYLPQMRITPSGEKAKRAYRKKYGIDIDYFALNDYNDDHCYVQTIEDAGSAEPKEIINTLEIIELERWGNYIKFPAERGLFYHHASTPVLITQFTKMNQHKKDCTIIYPADKATGRYIPVSEIL